MPKPNYGLEPQQREKEKAAKAEEKERRRKERREAEAVPLQQPGEVGSGDELHSGPEAR